MTTVRNWARGPFELIVHAEGHLRTGDDIDRRMALISFDNAVEVSITAYLTLNPVHRGGASYPNADVEKWLKNYHTKLDFIAHELTRRGSLPWKVEREDILWAHDQRNEQYHGGTGGVPAKRAITTIRSAAFWIFGLLFNVADVAKEVDDEIAALVPPKPAPRPDFDMAIDNEHGIVEIGELNYYASEVLFAVDRDAYSVVGEKLAKGGKRGGKE
ncbi:hypothetical protein [Polyangium fumosum]|uniref:Uncharacterized protein n=1 Tax=Polyangium fumosum TaxID=889272 RepID=A0A4U1IUA5_9BACT|nr:hypothetical protein [Polyangium fumosum]TKC97993.1 hypothetical protein E8A74_43150 [Polyangium fumosum]